MSMPTSRMASTATGLMRSAGCEPADRIATRSPPRCASQPAAICERPALWTQTNSTVGWSCGHAAASRGRDGQRPRHGIQGAHEQEAERTADELGEDERRDGRGCDAGEGVREHPRDRDRGVRERRRAGEPVGGEDVSADREGDLPGATGARGPEDHHEQADGRDHLAEPGAPDVARWCVDRSIASRSNIRLASTAPRKPPATCATDEQRRPRVLVEQAERALDRGDDRVEGGRDRLQRQDQRDQRAAGDHAVLEQLQARRRPVRAARRRCRSR